ncbi:phage/plasmid primase, P4 family [Burkholderia stagnalis]|uniref:phage/plasmid primase, P4 family n=1 Tax=Burkholderia stagnalis TaxID=1503054 RepID=UPI002AB5A290|nr:phage/plasmid primase, P4 family [Burkholderia stagnalis]MDY7802804.1 phage/plasmid primase, P4 family [Burkholderia stagnalis]
MNNDTLVAALAPIVSRVVTSHCWIKRDGPPSHINRPLTPERLAQHVNGGPAYGAAQIAPGESTTRVACLDLDSHKGETPWHDMQAVALRIMGWLEVCHQRPIPFRSSGGAGLHLYLLWDEPQDAYSVRCLLRDALLACDLRDGVKGVAAGQVEVFPKQNSVPSDGFGNMFVLPLAGKSVPLDAFELDDMPKAYAAEMDWPMSAPVPHVTREEITMPGAVDVPVELEVLKSALDMIPNAGGDELDYEQWRDVVFGIHHAARGGDDGLVLAHEFSARSSKYDPRFLDERVWPHIGKSSADERAPITGRTVLHLARAHGWQEPIEDDFEVAARVEAAAVGTPPRTEPAVEAAAPFDDSDVVVIDTEPPARPPRAPKKPAADTPPKGYRARTEFGNAERMLDRYGAGLMYVPELEAWFVWTGVYWRRAAQVELENMAKETIRALPDEAEELQTAEERIEFFKFCAVCQKAAMVSNMIRLAASDPRVVVPVTELDRHTHLLGVANGAVDLRTGELLAPDKEHRITVVTPVEYDPHAAGPLFEQTVRDVFFDDAEQVEFFQRLVGYAIRGEPEEDIIVIPHGDGSNGKSTVLGKIRDALGAHAKAAGPETFLSASGGQGAAAGAAREDLLRLRGARFVYVGEPDEGSELREGLIKAMTGGDPIPARGLWSKTTIEVVPTWVAFMPTNHRPIVKGDDHAIWRRLMLVPFERNFDRDKTIRKDPARAERLAAELPGVLAWCVRGALAYQQHGLRPTSSVAAARDAYKADMDLLADWIDERCRVGRDAASTNEDLWRSWRAFAEQRGELRFIANSRALARRIAARGFSQIKNTFGIRGRGFAGICVNDEVDFEGSDLA